MKQDGNSRSVLVAGGGMGELMVMLLSVDRSWAGFHSVPHSSNNDACVSALVLPLLPHVDLLGTGQPGTANSPSFSNSQVPVTTLSAPDTQGKG